MSLISTRVFKIPVIPGILMATHTRFVGVGKVMFNLRPARPPARPPTKSYLLARCADEVESRG